MKFQVTRVSKWYDEKPCDEATEEFFTFPSGERSVFTITFNTLDELMKFIEKYGDIVIYNGTYIKEIVIYDDYIE